MSVFEACELLDPSNIGRLRNTVGVRLSKLRFVDADYKAALLKELPKYIQLARTAVDIAPDNLNGWCRQHAGQLPAWSNLQELGALLQPTSASAERVFALQQSALADMIKCSIMLAYNERIKSRVPGQRDYPPVGTYATQLQLPGFAVQRNSSQALRRARAS